MHVVVFLLMLNNLAGSICMVKGHQYDECCLNAGLVVPTVPALAQAAPVAVPSSCLMLTNMFDPSDKEKPADWIADIREDVLEACIEFGDILHVHVDPKSLVCMYC